MRRLAGVGLCLVWAAAVAGCGPRPSLPDNLLVVGQSAEPRSLDPHVATATTDFRIAANIYDGLVRFADGSLEIEPALAERWEVAPDGKTYTFHLRRGVRFHDGTPFDAPAVRFNFGRLLEEDHPWRHTGPFPLAFFFEKIRAVETPDSHTVVFRLDEPFAPLLANLAYPTGFIVSPAAVAKHGKDFGRHPSGTGPFVFDRWESHRAVRLGRNPDYWDGPARLEHVVFRPLTDGNARLTELLTGGCDVVVDVPPDVVAYFRERPGFRILETTGPHLWFLILNTREGPFSDRRVRLAANLAIDREAMVRDLLQGTATLAAGPVPAAFVWATDEDEGPFPHDPDKARRLVAEAGYEGAEVTLFAAEGGSGMLAPREMAAAIQADLADAGLRVRIESFEWNTFLDRVNGGLEGQADMAQMAWMVNDPDTLPYLALRSDAWPEHGGFNSGYYANPEMDRLIREGRAAVDPAERGRVYRQLQRLAREDVPWVYVASWRQNAAVRDVVRGLELQPSFLFLLKDTWKETAP